MKINNYIKFSLAAAVIFLIAVNSQAVTNISKLPGKPVFFSKNNLQTNGFKAIANAFNIPADPIYKAALSRDNSGIIYGENGTPVFIDGKAASKLEPETSGTAAKTSDTAISFINENKKLFQLENPVEELSVKSEKISSDGFRHIVFSQNYRGIPVWGAEIAVHIKPDGKISSINGRYSPTPSGDLLSNLKLSGQNAADLARNDLSGKTNIIEEELITKLIPGYEGSTSELVILADIAEKSVKNPELCWLVRIRPNLTERWVYLINAGNGRVEKSYNETVHDTAFTAKAKGALGDSVIINTSLSGVTYYMTDLETNISIYTAEGKVISRNNDVKPVTSVNNIWSDSIAVSAHYNLRVTYDFYFDNFGRRGVDNINTALPVIVHFTEDGTSYRNAFWGGGYMAFGDGDRFAAALDVISHELTHGIIEKTVGLIYQSQSGALNESLADIMACMVDPDWDVGEDLNLGAIRNLLFPERYGQPGNMASYQNLPLSADNGGVHVNSGIPSRAAALFTEAIGRTKTNQIVYRIMESLYLTPQARFVDFRLAAVQASTDLYGEDSNETNEVKKAFDSVGITEGSPTLPPEEIIPPKGGETIAFDNNSLIYFAPPVIENTSDIKLASNTPIFTATACAKTVPRGGAVMYFVDAFNNLRSIDLLTGAETLLQNSGEWSSIAISPDGNLLAATTVYIDSSIYIFNIEDPEKSKIIQLYTPSTEGARSYTTLYADALDWNIDGTRLIFDSFHHVPVQGDTPIEFWDVNTIDNTTDLIYRVNLPIEPGAQAGNPFFSQTSDRYIICDMFSDARESSAVIIFDMFTLESSIISEKGYYSTPGGGFPNVGIGRFSPDDTSVIFQHYFPASNTLQIFYKNLEEDRMTPSSDSIYFADGGSPLWFVIGNGTVVANDHENHPDGFSLGSAYPNPFNPSVTIPFMVSKGGNYTIEVYDILGRKTAVLINKYLKAGSAAVRFDGSGLASGVYFYTMRSGQVSQTGRMMLLR